MEYTTKLNLKKPQETDVVRVEDFNENADTLDTMVGRVAPDRQGTQWETLLYRGGAPAWCGSLYNPILISEVVINKTGNVTDVVSLPTGWDTADLTGIWIEGNLSCTKLTADATGTSEVWPHLAFGYQPLSNVFFVQHKTYIGEENVNKSFVVQGLIPVTGKMDGAIQVGIQNIDFDTNYERGPRRSGGGRIAVGNGVAAVVTGCNLGFIASGFQEIWADSITGTIRFYALKGGVGSV